MKAFRNSKMCDGFGGYLFLLPNLLGFFVLTSLAVLASFLLGFSGWDAASQSGWVGARSASGTAFWEYAGNTLFLLMGIPAAIFLSLGLVLVLSRKLKGTVFYKVLYLVPAITTAASIHLLWRWIYEPHLGLLSSLLARVGAGSALTSGTVWANLPLVLVGFWIGIGGYSMVLYLAGLQTIDRELYDTAEMDGTSRWQEFRSVTWPMLIPTTFFILTLSVIAGLQGGFHAAYIMAGGNSACMYSGAHQWFKMGYAVFVTRFLSVLIPVVILFNWRYGYSLLNDRESSDTNG